MSQTYPEAQIKGALISLLNGIKASDGPVVAKEMAVLDDIVARQGDSLPPQLGHFLERRSYAKALVWLGGEAPAAGTCGPGKSR
jgi:hypothetical protein